MDIREILLANLYDDSDIVDAVVMDSSSDDDFFVKPVQWGGSRPGRSANANRDHAAGAQTIYRVGLCLQFIHFEFE